jgi:hypothetical protein
VKFLLGFLSGGARLPSAKWHQTVPPKGSKLGSTTHLLCGWLHLLGLHPNNETPKAKWSKVHWQCLKSCWLFDVFQPFWAAASKLV